MPTCCFLSILSVFKTCPRMNYARISSSCLFMILSSKLSHSLTIAIINEWIKMILLFLFLLFFVLSSDEKLEINPKYDILLNFKLPGCVSGKRFRGMSVFDCGFFVCLSLTISRDGNDISCPSCFLLFISKNGSFHAEKRHCWLFSFAPFSRGQKYFCLSYLRRRSANHANFCCFCLEKVY